MKVLLSAYACQPNRGSEPGVGWNVAKELSRWHEVWVLTRAENGVKIESELAAHPRANLHFAYYDLPYWARWWRKGLRGIQLHYYLWQLAIYRVARTLHERVGFDVSHHVTYVKYSSPSLLSLLPIPLVWGPVGGGENAPRPFREAFSFRGRVTERLRDWSRLAGDWDPLVRLTARRCAAAQATTAETARKLVELGAAEVRICSEVGLSPEEIEMLAEPATLREPATFMSLGRLLSWKGFHLGLEAFARSGLGEAEYWVVGDGPERVRLMRLAEELGVSGRVHFFGELGRGEALWRLRRCVALVHPSLHDSGGWVCVEAMATGRAVICLDLGGPGSQVTEDTGIKVAAESPGQAVAGLAEAMVRVASDRELRRRALVNGPKLVREQYCWEARCRSYSRLYQRVVDEWRGGGGGQSAAGKDLVVGAGSEDGAGL